MAEHFLCRGDLDAEPLPTGSEGSAKVMNNPVAESYLLLELASVVAPPAKGCTDARGKIKTIGIDGARLEDHS
jgi:hypothetical protein